MDFIYATQLASYITEATRKNWEGNLSIRDIRNYYVSCLMDCDNAAEANTIAQEILMFNNTNTPDPVVVTPAPVKVSTVAPVSVSGNRRRVGTSVALNALRERKMDGAIRKGMSLEDFIEAEQNRKAKEIRERKYSNRQFNPNNTSIPTGYAKYVNDQNT